VPDPSGQRSPPHPSRTQRYTRNSVVDKPGNAYLGISYYAYGDQCVDNPRTHQDECSNVS
jgi:hypothetical protein